MKVLKNRVIITQNDEIGSYWYYTVTGTGPVWSGDIDPSGFPLFVGGV
jgi:hypothetical protein